MSERGWVVVTGAAEGVGASTAKTLLEQGFGVVGVDFRFPEDYPSPEVLQVDGDITEQETLDRAFANCQDKRVVGLVNNAARQNRGRLPDVTRETFNSMMAVNALAPVLWIQRFEELLAESKGKVVNIGSVNAYGGGELLLEYAMSKAALMCATRNLAPSLSRRGIQICQINPAWVLSEAEKRRKVDEGWDPDWYEEWGPKQPYGRFLEPQEIGEFIAFLLSPSCRMLNGSIIDFASHPVGR